MKVAVRSSLYQFGLIRTKLSWPRMTATEKEGSAGWSRASAGSLPRETGLKVPVRHPVYLLLILR